jgi:hypothetical protein
MKKKKLQKKGKSKMTLPKRNVIPAEYTMKVEGLSCEFNLTTALKSRIVDGVEVAQGLPNYGRTVAYPVDQFPACPDHWMHGSAKASSYFLAVQEGKGAWLDFNRCIDDNHDVAIVVSVQGVNSVTGLATKELRLEQYVEKCPKHDVAFEQDRFCPECKYKWPKQNYLCTTGTPRGSLWLDGFRAADGIVRQYIITADEAKGVAAKKLGKDRVFAIGIAFYRSKQPTPVTVPQYSYRYPQAAGSLNASLGGTFGLKKGIAPASVDGWGSKDGGVVYGDSADLSYTTLDGAMNSSLDAVDDLPIGSSDVAPPTFFSPLSTPQNWTSEVKTSGKMLRSKSDSVLARSMPSLKPRGQSVGVSAPAPVIEQVTPKTFEVGAGARIDQPVHPDPKDLDYWEEQPAGMIYINYTSPECVQQILAAGMREEKDEGFLDDVPVGN